MSVTVVPQTVQDEKAWGEGISENSGRLSSESEY